MKPKFRCLEEQTLKKKKKGHKLGPVLICYQEIKLIKDTWTVLFEPSTPIGTARKKKE